MVGVIIAVFAVVALALLALAAILYRRRQQAAGTAGNVAGRRTRMPTAPYNDVKPGVLANNPMFNGSGSGGSAVAPGVGDNDYSSTPVVFDPAEYAVPDAAAVSGSVQWREEVRKPGASKSMVGMHGSSKPASTAGAAPAPSPPPRSTVESAIIAEWTGRGKSPILPAAEAELASVDPSYLAPVVLNPQ